MRQMSTTNLHNTGTALKGQCSKASLKKYLFGPWFRFPHLARDFTVLHNDPAAPQGHGGRCRIQTQDFCPNEPQHLHFFGIFIL